MSLAKQIEKQYRENKDMSIEGAVKTVLQPLIDERREKIEEKMQTQVSTSMTDLGRLELLQELEAEL